MKQIQARIVQLQRKNSELEVKLKEAEPNREDAYDLKTLLLAQCKNKREVLKSRTREVRKQWPGRVRHLQTE